MSFVRLSAASLHHRLMQRTWLALCIGCGHGPRTLCMCVRLLDALHPALPLALQGPRPSVHLPSPGQGVQACHQSLPVPLAPGTPKALCPSLCHPAFKSGLPRCQATCPGAKGHLLMSEWPSQMCFGFAECLLYTPAVTLTVTV